MGNYEESLEEFMERFYMLLEVANKNNGTQHGFIGLMIRDPSIGNIEIMHNCKNKNDIIKILDLTSQQLKENRDGNTRT